MFKKFFPMNIFIGKPNSNFIIEPLYIDFVFMKKQK